MFSKNDEAMHRGLMKILDEGTFPLKAREVPAFGNIYNWARNLPIEMKAREQAKNAGVEEQVEPDKPAKKKTTKKKVK